MKAYITKYALTQGILEEEGEVEKRAFYPAKNQYWRFNEKEWFTTREDAVLKAREMQMKKLASLEKQYKKISNLTFD